MKTKRLFMTKTSVFIELGSSKILDLLNKNYLNFFKKYLHKTTEEFKTNYTMKNAIKITLITILLIGQNNYAQDNNDTTSDFHTITVEVPQFAIIDIELDATTNIDMNFTKPLEAGLPIIAPIDDSSLWLNYSSIVSSGNTNSITTKINDLIPGIDVNVTAGSANGGFGTLGTPTSTVTLSTSDQSVINDIGSAYTEDGINKGHNLTYNIVSTGTYGNIVADTHIVTVTYTITEN